MHGITSIIHAICMYKPVTCRAILRAMTVKKPAPEKVEVRMPGELRAQLTEDAARDNRSINQQAVHYIQRGMQATDSCASALKRLDDKMNRILALLEKK